MDERVEALLADVLALEGEESTPASSDVRYWHKADILTRLADVRFWGQSGHCAESSEIAFPSAASAAFTCSWMRAQR
jgi:hypothetical protein